MPQKNASRQDLPLADIRVLDFGQFIAGPVCATLLGDLGADVIRIERTRGNADRFITPLSKQLPDIGAMYSIANRNKRSLAVEFATDDAREIINRLVQRSDVVVTNMPQRTLEKLRLDLPTLQQINPQIVVSNCSAYGDEGPWQGRPGFDGMAQAMCGAMHLSGENGEPRKSYVHFVDYYAGALSAVGVIATLLQRTATQTGGLVKTSLLASAMMMMNSALAEEAVLQPDRVGTGNRAQTAGPADAFDTKDGKVIMQVVGEARFAALTQVIGHEELLKDPRFASDNLRGENSQALNEFVQNWCAQLTSTECVDALIEAGLCASPVLSPAEALAHPQVREHSSRHDINYKDADIEVPVFLPIATAGRRSPPPKPAPRLGENSRSILSELGYSVAEVDKLVESGLVRSA